MAWSIEGQRVCPYTGLDAGRSRPFLGVHLLAAAVLCTAAAGCAVDSRTLTGANGTSGAGSTGGTSGAGASNGFSGAPSPIDLPDCSYSTAVEPGCETMVANAGFGRDTSGWEEEPLAITIGWDKGDAAGSEESGSIAVVNSMHGQNDGIAPGGGAQCLPAIPGAIYDMAADVLIPDGQGKGFGDGPYVGRAGLSILFWPNDTCSIADRSLVPSYQTNLVEDVETWSRVEGSALAPDGAGSMSVRVLTVKPFYEYNFKALFDNVLLQER